MSQSGNRQPPDFFDQLSSAEQLSLQTCILQSMTEGVSIADERGIIVFTNSSEDRMFGYEPGELIGQHVGVQNAYPPEENDRIVAEVIEQLRARGAWAGHWHNRRKDGSTFFTDSHISAMEWGGRRFWVCVQRDITHQRRAETALAQSEERFRQLANAIPQLAWMARPDGSIFWYNQRWYDYTGTSFEQMEGWGWKRILDPAELPRVLAGYQAAIAGGQPWEDTFPLRRHDGQFCWHLTRALPLCDPEGNVLLWIGTNTDITEQRRYTQERQDLLESERAARAEAEHASRLKDDFLATLSHELRTPLNAILGWSQLLEHGPGDQAELAEGLAAITRNARVQTQLIDDLLDLSRIVSGTLRLDVQRVDLRYVIEAAVESVRPMAQARRIELRPRFDPGASRVAGDPQRLQQVVWNLLSNAVKFTPIGGSIEISLLQQDTHIHLNVSDTGQGIRPEFLPHLFERFRQADGTTTRRHGGLGIGLALVRQLVELHGGTITASSGGEGRGATFTICLQALSPARANDAGRQTASAEGDQTQRMTLAGLSVLVVDDEPDARTLAKRILEYSGATAMVAGSADEALRVIRERRPDVLLSDIGMPVVDGYQFIRSLRSLDQGQGGLTPAAAFTAFARDEDRRRALLAGFQAHIVKPISAVELVNVVAGLAGRASGAARTPGE